MPHEGSGSVKSATRVLDVFELLARGEEMSHASFADALRIPKSSLTQLLRTLVARGCIEFAASTKGYRLGEAFSRLSQRTGEVRDLVAFVQPVLSAAGYPLGSLNVAIPAVRYDAAARDRAIAVLRSAAERIRRQFIEGEAPRAPRRRGRNVASLGNARNG